MSGKYVTAYTGGTNISGFVNIGNIAVDGTGTGDYSLASFVGGVLGTYDSNGYVIISDTTTAGVVGRTTGGNTEGPASANTPTFWVSPTKDDVGFLFLVNKLPARSGQTPFTTGSDAKTWLNNNGYWTSYTSSIITTDLSLMLDAGDLTSYSGTGLTWSDISGNNNHVTMVNSSSINWLDNGIGYFTTGSNGWFSKTGGVNLPIGNSNYTLSAWIQLGTSWNSNGIVSVGPFGSSNQANALRTGSTNQIINYWWGNDFAANSSVSPTNSWFNIVAKYNGTTRSVFINGVSIGTDTPSGHNVTTSNIQVAKTYNNEYLQGNIAQVLIYKAALSDVDIVTNYNATKSRFTLTISTNAAGGFDGFNVGGQAVAFQITSNPAIGTTYPIGSQITFQNGEVRTFVGYDDYGSVYDMFYDSPISTGTLFPITIG